MLMLTLMLLVIACQTEVPQLAPIEEEPVVAEEVAPEAPPAPAVVKRADCVFADENRTEDENGRVTVNCAGEIFQAKATYVLGGSFDFEIETPAALAAAPVATPAATP